jgi:hypothetical protein
VSARRPKVEAISAVQGVFCRLCRRSRKYLSAINGCT